MKRHIKIGFLVALIVASIITVTGIVCKNADPGTWFTILIAPAIPFLIICPQPMGESQVGTPWDYLVLAIVVVIASVFWGFIAGLLSRYVFGRRKNAA